MKLLGKKVTHKIFGKGIVSNLRENKITVRFENSEKLFIFPDAIPRYLIFQNTSIQKKVESINEEREQEMCKKKQEIEKDIEYRNRLYTMKFVSKSQVAYNILENSISDMEYVETGCYLSGDRKGYPRIPTNIQPSSAIVLTYRFSDDEDSRMIIGVVMVNDRFWGKECKDGHINLHEKYQMVLPIEDHIPFWKYFKRKDIPEQWGNIPFKYFQYQTMEIILLDICQNAVGTEKEDNALEFYRYFCRLNRLVEKLK